MNELEFIGREVDGTNGLKVVQSFEGAGIFRNWH